MDFFSTRRKEDCTGCEACANGCPKDAITMIEDSERFRYPQIDTLKCVSCNRCSKICEDKNRHLNPVHECVFGGFSLDQDDLRSSTSGAAFSAIAKGWWTPGSLILGAVSSNIFEAAHAWVGSIAEIGAFRGSKYTQSSIGYAYRKVKKSLIEGRPVLFSGTPCQIGGLFSFLGNVDKSKLLTIEVICEGVPTPLFMEKMISSLNRKVFFSEPISSMSYRDKAVDRWDYQVMGFFSPTKRYMIDRWFNPFWSIWLDHLMSRPSCYNCPFAKPERGADITLGDLWGVHLYCPDLYNNNRGASLIFCNTNKGKEALNRAMPNMYLRELPYSEALKYQGPMRRRLAENGRRDEFFEDLKADSFDYVCRKWAKRPSIKLLISKYIYGTNRQVCKKAIRKRRKSTE